MSQDLVADVIRSGQDGSGMHVSYLPSQLTSISSKLPSCAGVSFPEVESVVDENTKLRNYLPQLIEGMEALNVQIQSLTEENRNFRGQLQSLTDENLKFRDQLTHHEFVIGGLEESNKKKDEKIAKFVCGFEQVVRFISSNFTSILLEQE